jgi:uncharacterized protein YjiS (DUF1127 family)
MQIWPSCSATKLLFNRCEIPILRVVQMNGQRLNLPAPILRERRTIMFAAIVRFIQEWKRYNQSLNELSRLGDRELADIGVSRSDISRLAWSAARKR